MPQMGESIFEGTITKWLKKVGDTVQRDEPLFEISTDKVDAEIPAPAAGVLTDIKVPEGSTVEINTVVAVIGGSAAGAGAPVAAAPAEKQAGTPPTATPAAAPAASSSAPSEIGEQGRSSPLVRRIAKDNNLDLSKISGTGAGGRITKEDALAYLSQQSKGPVCAGCRQSGGRSCALGRAFIGGFCDCTGIHTGRTGPIIENACHHRAADGGVEAHQCPCPQCVQD